MEDIKDALRDSYWRDTVKEDEERLSGKENVIVMAGCEELC
jgi:hypothetical protein